MEFTLAAHGRIDVLVNNAGQGFYSSVCDTDVDMYRAILAVNLIAPLAAMRAAVPHMRRRGSGVI
ncbi:MAG TPA: SDR family NAD(P)-dependent oxidoreductase, partial [Acidimicrobiales bacterium]|nr:SDR family NAD(P)-dependent oxidoreductase [Acidimicrobiales bacterium]